MKAASFGASYEPSRLRQAISANFDWDAVWLLYVKTGGHQQFAIREKFAAQHNSVTLSSALANI